MNCEFWRGRRSTLWDVQRRQRTEDEDELSEIVGDVPPFRVQPWSRGSSVTDTTRPPDLPTSAASSFRRPAGPAQGPGFSGPTASRCTPPNGRRRLDQAGTCLRRDLHGTHLNTRELVLRRTSVLTSSPELARTLNARDFGL